MRSEREARVTSVTCHEWEGWLASACDQRRREARSASPTESARLAIALEPWMSCVIARSTADGGAAAVDWSTRVGARRSRYEKRESTLVCGDSRAEDVGGGAEAAGAPEWRAGADVFAG